MCQYNDSIGNDYNVSACLKFYVLDAENGNIETMIGYSYNEDENYTIATYTMTEEERALYTISSATGEFSSTVGSITGFDDVTVKWN